RRDAQHSPGNADIGEDNQHERNSEKHQAHEQQQLLYGLFLCMYLVTLTGNVLIILAIGSNPHLHTPMYFFLANLSFADMGLISSTVTKMLFNVRTQHRTISYTGCLTQMYLFMMFDDLDSFFLDVMAYDR
ncbi:hypothetical protein A6R68_01646, partial [Neotoma lepida]